MAHLGADVAAFVDGQLSDSATREALTHLQTCDACAKAVRQQRLLKSRMSTVATPEPPAQLLASLSGLASAPPPRERWWTRLCHSVPFRAGVVLASASAALVMTAYAMGGPERRGDEVAPPFDQYAADFFGATAAQAGHVMADTAMAELDTAGWPCHETLAGDLHRTWGALTAGGDVVALTYSNGRAKLNLFEQVGILDPDSVAGFDQQRLGDAEVWVRHGEPMLVTWDDDGVVYTIVTDADRDRVARAVAALPQGAPDVGPRQRVRDGLERLTAWADAA